MENKLKNLREKSYELGYWTAIWESTPGGVGLSTEELDKLRNEIDSLEKELEEQ